ncbi:sensor histidine kinase [Thiomicrorhabdus indica]|uniref:sensor histidine kinase n=1 Tax=Thiomicrorhabdus indica TaxID=2267253 RepID=UPI002AA8A93F|nr:sensor histidine kinase [Thiomicrorhabdus indica]
MKASLINVLLFVMTVFIHNVGHAQSTSHHQIPQFEVYIDQSKSLAIQDITQLNDDAFRPVAKAGYVGGYNRFHHWLKFTIQPPEDRKSSLILRVSPTYLDSVTLYLPDAAGGFRVLRSGDTVETQATQSDRALLFELGVMSEPTTAYIEFHAINTHTLVADIYSPDNYRHALLVDYALSGIFIGLLLALIFINLGYGQWRTDASFRNYLLFIFASLLVFIAVHGWVQYFLPDSWRGWGNYLPQLTTLIYLWVLNSVHRALFEFERHTTPVYYWISKIYQLSVVLGFVSLVFDFYIEYMPTFMKITLVYLLLIVFYAFYLTVRKIEEGGWLFLASIFGLTGIFGTVLSLGGLVSGGALLMYSYTAGTLGSIIVFQTIMSRRIRKIEQDRVTAVLDKEHAQMLAEKEKTDKEQKSQFLSMLSHELKTPLSVISMGLHRPTMSDRSRQHLLQAVSDMSMVIDRCAVLEKVDDQIHSESKPVEIVSLLKQVMESFQSQRIEFVECDGQLVINSDEDWLRVIFINLIDNALKYSPKDQTIQVTLSTTDDKVCVQVTNPTQEALPEADEIFTKYYRAKTAHKQTGSGLGLYIVKRLTDQLQAQISYRPVEKHTAGDDYDLVEMRLCLNMSN